MVVLFFNFVVYSQNKIGVLHVSVVDQEKRILNNGTVRIRRIKFDVVEKASSSERRPADSLASAKGSLEKTFPISNTGVVVFDALPLGEYVLEVASFGFKPFTTNITIKEGRNEVRAELRVKEIKVDIDVERSKREERFDEAFNTVLTEEEIRAMDDVEAELKRRYGEDILIQVDGFTGARLPPKEHIASIKIIKNSFDAEFHEAGRIIIKITTKAGVGRWVGMGSFNFGDARLNARNAFEEERLPKQERSFSGFLSGPLIKNKTSLDLSFYEAADVEKRNIIAIVPGRTIENELKTRFSMFTGMIGIRHNLAKTQNIKLEYEFNKSSSTNIGVGNFSLPENGYANNNEGHKLRFGSDGILADRFVNEFRAQLHLSEEEAKPNSTERGIIVSDAFNAGGAGVDNSSDSRKLTIANNLLFDSGKHAFKLGGYLEFERYKSLSADNTNGSFAFTDLLAYQLGLASIFRQRRGTSATNVNQSQWALYFQDDIRLDKNFQVGIGLRYEHQSNLNDANNFSPRLSFTYSPFKDGKMVFRGGVGVFYDWFEIRDLEHILSNDGRQAKELIIYYPGFPNPHDGGFVSASLPPSVRRKDGKLKNPYVLVVQSAFNYRASKHLVVEGSYKFEREARQLRSRDLNAPIDGRRPNPRFGGIESLEASGKLINHAFELRAQAALLKGIGVGVRYKLSKSKNDYGWKFGLPVNSNDLGGDFGFSGLDRRHYLTGALNIPLFHNVRLMPTFRIASPYPYTITTGFDDNRDTVFNDRPLGVPRNSARGAWFSQFDLRIGWDIPLFKVESNNSAKDKDKSAKDKKPPRRKAIGFDIIIENIFNRANLKGFVGNQLSPFFGQPTYASQPRGITFGLRFMFF